MNLRGQENMFAETPVNENAGDRAEPSLIDLDYVLGKLSVSPLPYEVTCLNADESSTGMATSDVSGADFLSAFDSVRFDVHSKLGDDVLKDIIGADSIYGVDSFGQAPDVSKDTSEFNLAVGISELSSQRDGEAEVMGDEAHQSDHPLIVYTSSQRRSLCNSRSNQINKSQKTSEVRTNITENNSVVDLCSLLTLRRRRSLSATRSRSYVWGSMVDNLPDSEEHSGLNSNLSKGKKQSTKKCVKKSRSSIRDQDDKKSQQKGCRPAGPLSFKIKLRNQSCAIGNVKEKKTIHELFDSKENKVAEELPGDMVLPCQRNLEKVISTDASILSQHLDVTGTFENPSFNISIYHHQVSGQVVGDDLVAYPENRFSDVGTSPDSEVINSLSDALLFDKVPQNMQGTPIISNNVCASMGGVSSFSLQKLKSKNEKKKDKHYQLGIPSLERNLSGAEATTATAVVEAAAEHELIPCRSGKKFPKGSPAKGGGKNRSGNLDLPCKKENASKKKGTKNNIGGKHKINEAVGVNGALSRAENHLAAGTSSVLGESAAPSKVLNGAMNNLHFISSGERNQIDQLRNAWVLCDECQKWRRIPAVLADQIEETNRGWICKDNMDKDFADCSIPQEKSNSQINQELEMSDEDAGDALLMSNQNRFKVTKESSWSIIKSNLFLHRSRKKQTIDEVMVCHCKHPSNGRMGCGAKCLNRILNIECVKGTCPCGELCSNQQFQKRKYAKLERFKCGKKGYGLQALEAISEGQFLIEYVGEVLDMHAYEERQRQYALNGHRHFYFMTLNGSEVIDACAKGNLGRFINHSCDPNCRTEKWMVNGEVCVGLFAIRDIKKGEEVTFDYNYVRVFGAAARKCVCGSLSCRGYIGGDPTNSETIIQSDSDDEYLESVVICEDDEMKSEWSDMVLNSFDNRENKSANEPPEHRDRMKKPVCVVTHLESTAGAHNLETSTPKVCVDSTSTMAKTSIAGKVVETVVEEDKFVDRIHPATVGELDVNQVTGESLQLVGVLNETLSTDQHEFRIAQKALTNSVSSAHGLELITAVSPNKSLPDTVGCKTKLKRADVGGKHELAKSYSLAKTRRSSSIKKENIKFNVLKEKETPVVDQFRAPHKSKKQPQSLNSQFEAVEEKLNDLLEPQGGISKRKDASRGYLKLLFLTAASGNDAHGEAIQSNRDLSMILDALLKTKSQSVLVDIINKNGLQMLHNIMKRYRNIYNKTPILRKLLKVLEYLAMREILTLEHITGGPPRPGVESFKDSILALTEHVDKQVHQIARNFRDRWIPRSLRKNCCNGRDDGRIESHRSSVSSVALSSEVQTTASGTNQSSALDQAASGSNNNETAEKKPRKRKSRWDTPAEECPQSKLKINMEPEIDDDKPPGFSSSCHNAMVSSDCSSTVSNPERNLSTKLSFDIVLGNSQQRYISHMPISYGVPVSIVQQFGVESCTGWIVGPGVPFYPFPPLPPYEKGDRPIEPTEKSDFGGDACTDHYAGKTHTRTWSEELEENKVPSGQRGGSHCLDRKYFKQQKLNHSKLAPPWVRMRNGWGHNGNN